MKYIIVSLFVCVFSLEVQTSYAVVKNSKSEPQILTEDIQLVLDEARKINESKGEEAAINFVQAVSEYGQVRAYDKAMLDLYVGRLYYNAGQFINAKTALNRSLSSQRLLDEQRSIAQTMLLNIAHQTKDFQSVIDTLTIDVLIDSQQLLLLTNAYFHMQKCSSLLALIDASEFKLKVETEAYYRIHCIKNEEDKAIFIKWLDAQTLEQAQLISIKDLSIQKQFWSIALHTQQKIMNSTEVYTYEAYEHTYKLYLKNKLFYEAAKYWLSLIQANRVNQDDESYLYVVKPLFKIDHKSAILFIFNEHHLKHNASVKTVMMQWYYQQHEWEALITLYELGVSLASLKDYGQITVFAAIAYYHLGKTREAYEMFEEALNYPSVSELAAQWLKFLHEVDINSASSLK